MKFFSGFCVKIDKEFFREYLEKREFIVAGFSYGAQKALEYVLHCTHRVDKLQLLSPAFFDYSEKIISLNLKAFKKDKNAYIKNFLTKAGINKWKMKNGKWEINENYIKVCQCSEKELLELFNFDWEKIKKLKNIKIEVFLGEKDKIISVNKAYEFFKEVGSVYMIKNANHFLRRNIAY